MALTAAEIAFALGGAKRDGADWRCRCPAHDDHDPSLSIVERGGKTLFTCRAGCEQAAVISALRERGLWDKPIESANGRRRIVAVYSYRADDGALRYQVCRTEPKGFFQRRPNGSTDCFINNVDGVEPLPYRLPELLQDPEATVFVAEGEKDVDNLYDARIVATCNHGGARKWRSEISHWLTGRHVVILPDNDEAGRARPRRRRKAGRPRRQHTHRRTSRPASERRRNRLARRRRLGRRARAAGRRCAGIRRRWPGRGRGGSPMCCCGTASYC